MGGRKVYVWGEKWPAACWVGERKERKGKKKQKKKLAGCSWLVGGERKQREREREKKACCFVPGWVGERKKKKKKKAPLCTWLDAWRGKKIIYRRPARWGAWPAREKKYIAGQMAAWPAREKNNKKKKQEDSETCGWNSKFENMAGENVMEFYFF
jgi:hypothetical protein